VVALGLVAALAARDGDDGRSGGARDPHASDAGIVVDDGPEAFGYPVPELTALQRRAFVVGNALFRTNWVPAPASAEGTDGLGPLYNARSCSTCHFKDGRGHPPASIDDEPGGLLIRLSSKIYGGQLQDHAIDGVRAEGRIAIDVELLHGRHADGTAWELAVPHYRIVDAAYGPIATDAPMSPRIAPQMVGLGLLENVPEAEVVARADADDRDGDGISGRPHWVVVDGVRRLGRFGWKASQPTVRAQAAAAFANDMGITSSLVPRDDETEAEHAAIGEIPSGGSPELSDHRLDRVAFYSAALAVPARRDASLPEVVRGEARFVAIGCARCHVPELVTGDDGEIEGLRRKRFHPYTDLLLHDLGERLADSIPDEEVAPSEWRTPPLWGIGLFEVVNGHHRYLHDGRARSLEEAILWHGGEAELATAAFRASSASERADLVRFLQSL
jgi:CxxC motif-containing protein (DUF1111 family)